MILTDNETKVDLLNNEAIATTITKLLRDRPDRPVTVGVHGDWGAGKSSVLEMIEAGFGGEEKVLCLKFNGWRFQRFEDHKIALIDGVSGAVGPAPDEARRVYWVCPLVAESEISDLAAAEERFADLKKHFGAK